MKFCLGAQPLRAPPSTRHRIATLGWILALALLAGDAAAAGTVRTELRQQGVGGGHASPASMGECAPCASCYLETSLAERVSEGAGTAQRTQPRAYLSPRRREQWAWQLAQPRTLLPVRVLYSRWLN